MTNDFKYINSSAVKAIRVNNNDLHILYQGNDVIYVYNGAAIRYNELLAAESIGRFVNSQIKGQYNVSRYELL